MNAIYKSKIFKAVDYTYLVILATFPLALIFGNFLTNLFIFLFSISFFINFNENKSIFNNKVFYLLAFFFLSLIINVIFSLNSENSLPRAIKIFFIIIFIFEIKRLFKNYQNSHFKLIYKTWFIVFLILTIDIIFEIIFGYNITGNKSYMPGRISSFFGDELVVGAFYHGFVLFFLSFLIFKNSKSYFLIISICVVLLVSFFIGERSNFIKLFISVIFFSFLALNYNYKSKLVALVFVIIALITFINLNDTYKLRYFVQLKVLFSENGYSDYLKKSQYGAHRDAAIKIFKDNILFGTGIKNFRYESSKKKYENKEFLKTEIRQATHPHQIHYEFLSETGIFGYICFIVFILSSVYLGFKSYLSSRNLYQLSSIIFIITSLLPLLPSGSFLSTYTSGIFWLNFAIMNGYIKN
jgi:O-antigen ligase